MQFKGLIARGSPPNPLYALILRVAILVISVIVLGIGAWGVDLVNNPSRYLRKRETVDVPGFGEVDLSDFTSDIGSSNSLGGISSSPSGTWHDEDPFALAIFSALYTAIAVIAITVVERLAPRYIFRIGPIITYSLGWVFLLATWALAANDAAFLKSFGADKADKYSKNLYAADATVAGLGAVLWLLTTAELALYILRCLKNPDSIGNEEQPTQIQMTPAKTETGYGAGSHPQSQPSYGQPPQGPVPA